MVYKDKKRKITVSARFIYALSALITATISSIALLIS